MKHARHGTGLRRLALAFHCSLKGIAAAWRHEAAFRQETVLLILLLPLGLWLGRNGVERALLLAPCLLVVVVELLNSALEAAVDRMGEEHHPLAGRAKDMGSAAVFTSLILTGLVWALALFDHLF